LAVANLVYPGATHTRFEHSLGCLHLSDLIYQAIVRQVEDGACPDFAEAFGKSDDKRQRGRRILRLASLLHDLGHMPFSHRGEEFLPEDECNGEKRKVKHEDMTARLVRGTEIADKLGQEMVEEVIAVATKPELAQLPSGADLPWLGFLNNILAGELGSDRMDYLLRDATHSGQNAGLFDCRKLIDSMVIVPPAEETGEPHCLGLDEGGWLVGEQMVAARYLMYVALYFHKTSRIYEIHLGRFLAHWLTQKYGRPCFPISNLSQYTRLTDSHIWAAILEAATGPDAELCRLARPFVDRSHLRLAHELLLTDNSIPADDVEPDVRKAVADRLRAPLAFLLDTEGAVSALSQELTQFIGGRHPRVWDAARFDKLVTAVHNAHVRDQLDIASDETQSHAAQFFDPKNKIRVYLNGKTRYLDELSEIVSGMADRIWRGRIYAAKGIKDDVKSFCDKWLKDNPPAAGDHDVPDRP
jgi:HD superfamily phosphohydrolase